jgi:hypothetical protein
MRLGYVGSRNSGLHNIQDGSAVAARGAKRGRDTYEVTDTVQI